MPLIHYLAASVAVLFDYLSRLKEIHQSFNVTALAQLLQMYIVALLECLCRPKEFHKALCATILP